MKSPLVKTLLAGAAAVALSACGGPASSNSGGAQSGTADQAIAAFSLDSQDSGRFSYSASELDGSTARFDTLSADMDDASVTAGRLDFEGLGMSSEGEPVFSKMTLRDVTVTPDDASEGEVNFDMITLDDPSPETAAYVASLFGKGEPAAKPAMSDIKFSLFEVDGISMDVNDGEESFDGSIANFKIEDMTGDEAGMVSLGDAEFTAGDDSDGGPFMIKLGGAEATNLDMSRYAEGDADPEEALEGLLMQMASGSIDPGYDTASFTDFTFEGQGVSVDAPSLEAEVKRNSDGQPTRIINEPYTVTVSADPAGGELGEQLAGPLSLMGYEELRLSGASDMGYDPDSDILTMDAGDNYFTVNDGATFRLGSRIGGYDAYSRAIAEAMGDDPAAMTDPSVSMGAFSELTLFGFDFTFEDDGLMERAFNAAAAQQGGDPAALREQSAAQLEEMAPMAGMFGVDQALVDELVGAVASFVRDPQTLTISLQPDEPIDAAFGQQLMQDPTLASKERFGFSASNN